MINDLIIIFLGIALAIGLVVGIAFILQKWLVDRKLSSKPTVPLSERHSPKYPELSKKIQMNSGIAFPTFEIEALLSVPDSNESIVMLGHKQAFQNVLRCNSNGSVVWVAELPEILGMPEFFRRSGDGYTHVVWDKQKLRAYSGSGFSVVLGVETGRILSSEFVK